MMAELGPNYNIQCMKLFQELKTTFPNIPDSVVRHCMKQVKYSPGHLETGHSNFVLNTVASRISVARTVKRSLKNLSTSQSEMSFALKNQSPSIGAYKCFKLDFMGTGDYHSCCQI